MNRQPEPLHSEGMKNVYQDTLSTLQWWQEQGRPSLGAFIYGSVAQHKTVLPGSDIDLCIVTPDEPEPAWFEERRVGSSIIEIYPLAQQALDNLDHVLTQPALPFNLCEGIIVTDPLHLLSRAKIYLIPQLCTPFFQHKRLALCYHQAQIAYQQAQRAFDTADLAHARFQITIGLWNTIGMLCASICRCPTNRRGFVLLWQYASQWQRPDLLEKAKQALGNTDLNWQELQVLIDQATLIKARAHESILSMKNTTTDIAQAVWPLLYTTVWEGSADRRDPHIQQKILSALHYTTPEHIAQCYRAASELTQSLYDIGFPLLQGT